MYRKISKGNKTWFLSGWSGGRGCVAHFRRYIRPGDRRLACGIWLRGAVTANHVVYYDHAHWCVYTIEGEGFLIGSAHSLGEAKKESNSAISLYLREYRDCQKNGF